MRRRTLLLAGLATPALAQERPITIIVPSPAGGGTDFNARLVSEPLGRLLGATVVVENRPGGNDVVGLQAVLSARADGTTLLCGYAGTVAGRAAVGGLGAIVPMRDFVPLGLISDTPQLVVVHPSVPATTLGEFVAHARAQPGALAYASAGNGSMHHLSAEYLKLRTGMDLLHVPYRGTGETLRDLIAGRVQFYTNSPPPLVPLVRDGRLRALCVTSDARHPGLPDIPAAGEQGFSGMPINVWFSLFAPRGTPDAVAQRLSAALRSVVSDPALAARALEAGAILAPSSAAELGERLRRETASWAEVAQRAGITG